ncbi:hypothetical protein GCM10028820_14720 [Tessaracoccus terricola]
MEHTFNTVGVATIAIEVGSGNVEVVTGEIEGQVLVTVDGDGASETTVEQQDGLIVITGPRRRVERTGNPLRVGISAPAGSHLRGLLGDANLVVTGSLGDVALNCGSGDVTLEDVGTLQLTTGSGGLHVNGVAGRGSVRGGSGDLRVREVTEDLRANLGSGDLVVTTVGGTLTAKSGSGDVRVEGHLGGAEINTASGDVAVREMDSGSLEARTASGDIAVGVAPGVPVWTDISTITGDINSALAELGRPEEGAPFVELRLRTVTGDIAVAHLTAVAIP